MGRHQIGIDDVEGQEYPEILGKKRKAQREDCRTSCVIWTIIIALSLCMTVAITLLHDEVHYYVAIDSVSISSDLDPAAAGRLWFNLTLGVYSWSYGAKACIKPGTYLQVSYRGAELAASEAETGQLCVGPRKSDQQRVIATGGVPEGKVLDSLAADMKQGLAVFDVVLHLPAWSYGASASYHGESCVSECGSMRVGAATVWCDAPFQMPTVVGPQ